MMIFQFPVLVCQRVTLSRIQMLVKSPSARRRKGLAHLPPPPLPQLHRSRLSPLRLNGDDLTGHASDIRIY